MNAEQEDGWLRGRRDGDAEAGELAVFLQAVRETLVAPSGDVEPALIPRLAEVARSSAHDAGGTTGTSAGAVAGAPGWRGGISDRVQARIPRFVPRSRLALVARAVTVVLLLPALMAALAFAGVVLPDPAREAFERVGIDLPNQSAVDEEGENAGAAGGGPGAGVSTPAGTPTPAGAKKGAGKLQQNGTKPGRRVQRHGTGPIPGPANPPEGLALGRTLGKANPPATPGPKAGSRGRSSDAPRGGLRRGRN